MFLSECHHDATNWCPGTGNSEVAAVVCVDKQADLAPDLYALMSSVYLEDKHLFFLQVSFVATIVLCWYICQYWQNTVLYYLISTVDI